MLGAAPSLPRSLRPVVLGVTALAVVLSLVPRLAASRSPGNHQGYEPEQPIAYSHRLHAGELAIPCQYCHTGAETSRHATIPSANICMNCHRSVTAPWSAIQAEHEQAKAEGRKARPVVSPEIRKLYDALGLDERGAPDPARGPQPIRWTRVHRLPDFATFDHRAHVGAGVACQTCHGPVETMERVRQFSDLSMGWCVNCHRDAAANGVNGRPAAPSVDCSACHH